MAMPLSKKGHYKNTQTGTLVQGPTLNAGALAVNSISNKGAKLDLGVNLIKAEGKKAGFTLGPNINTGITKKQGQTDVNLLGIGVSVGKRTGINTPIGSVYHIANQYVDDEPNDDFYDDYDDLDYDDLDYDGDYDD
ncbi:hypothetical protein HDU91_002143 [Kappamyces sp. JEL0680]|nr:hypothetical protein HDU91_002143 [Kappamyces sp. JEL0680]